MFMIVGQSWLQLNGKKSIESQTRLMSWNWKQESTWRKDLITYNSHHWIMFYFNWLVIIWRERERWGEMGLLETVRPRSRGWKNFGHRWTREMGYLENWTIFMDVTCVSSLRNLCNYRKLDARYIQNFCLFRSRVCQLLLNV